MNKKNKGLADNQDGDFILNESGTSVSIDSSSPEKDKNSLVETNQEASAKNEAIGEAEIQKYDDINPGHKAFEDVDEVQSTDDV